MESLFALLQENAKKAKKENEKLEPKVNKLNEICDQLEKKVLEIKDNETEH